MLWTALAVEAKQQSDDGEALIALLLRHYVHMAPPRSIERRSIENELESYFRRWKLTRLATFFWLKVTLEGDPVCSFNSSHKLPYERLVFASRTEYSTRYSAISAADGKVLVRYLKLNCTDGGAVSETADTADSKAIRSRPGTVSLGVPSTS
ncbi:hypothetical protein OSTOST_07589 [Ostertagia ostertagi]